MFALLLPRRVRERVFEPAYADLLLDDQEARRTSRPKTARRLGAGAVLVLESLRLGLPSYFWQDGRITRFGRSAIVLLVSSMIVVFLLATLAKSY